MLFTIVIIAILAALLLPVLARSKNSAQSIRCVSNLRQFGLAMRMYWDDNTGNCFRYWLGGTNGGQLYWFGWISGGPEGQRDFDATQGALYPYLRGRGVELCPAFNYTLSQFKLKANGATCGYGYNWYLFSQAGKPPMNIARVAQPTFITMFADAAQINTWQAPASPDNPMIEEWYYVDDTGDPPNAHFRHAQKANVIFCDGHVAPENYVPGSIDSALPNQLVGLLRPKILNPQ